MARKPQLAFGIAVVTIALLGFLDATFLTIKHYTGGPIPCSIVNGCEIVTTSKYATIAGVPVALLGAGYYLVMLVLGILTIERGRGWLRLAAWFSLAGILASAYLVYLQAAVLHAYCLYCLGSALTSTLLAGVSWWGWSTAKRSSLPPAPNLPSA